VEITTNEYKRLVAVTIRGRVDSTTSGELESRLRDLLDQGHGNLMLDLSGVEFLSSSGLRVLVTVQKAVRQLGGALALAQPAEQAADAIAISGLDTYFQTYPSREAAIGSF
jgi:anti-sigma B factor antagonist